MRPAFKALAVIAILLGLALPAHATDITLTPSTALCGSPACLAQTGNDTSTAVINSIIFSTYGVTEAYTMNYPGGVGDESGAAAAWYNTTFNADASGGAVTWNGPGTISGPTYFLVKDGNQTPAWYLFNISNWDGKSTIDFSGFWPGNGSISHVSIFGTTSVPDGGSMAMLLGMALMGLAGVRRLIK